MENKKYKVNSINKIIKEMNELLEIWDEDLDNNYPFDKSLDELLIEVINWRDIQSK